MWAGLAAAAVYFGVACAIISTDIITARAGFDDLMNHEPTIREFARQWPRFDFTDYLSATTPGYHLLLAGVVKFVSADRHLLQVVSASIGAAWIGLMVALAARLAGVARGVVFVLPLAMSAYVLQSAAYLLPDDISWLMLLVAMLLYLGKWTPGRAAAAGVATLLAVFVRQPLIWLVGVAWLAAWLSAAEPKPGRALLRSVFVENLRTRLARTGVAIATTLPALGLMEYFAAIWHGLTVPRYQHLHEGVGVSTPVFVLANIGFSSLFFVVSLWPIVRELWQRARVSVVLVGVGAAAIGVLQPSTFDEPAGRGSGLWTLGQRLPHVGDVSLFIFGLAVVGGVALLAWLATFDTRRRLILLAALAGFTAAQTMNKITAQRYVEPFVMMLVVLAAARCVGLCAPRLRRWLLVGPLVYAMFCIAVNLYTYKGSMLIKDYPRADAALGVEGGPYIRPEDRPKGPVSAPSLKP
jgi:hypothetical protein